MCCCSAKPLICVDCLQVELPDSPATCVAVSPDQSQLAIGTKDGRIVVLGCDREYDVHCVCMASSVTEESGHSGYVFSRV